MLLAEARFARARLQYPRQLRPCKDALRKPSRASRGQVAPSLSAHAPLIFKDAIRVAVLRAET